MLGPVRVFPDHLFMVKELRVVSVMEVNIPVAETTVTLLFEKLGGLGGSPKLLNLRGIRELTQKKPKK